MKPCTRSATCNARSHFSNCPVLTPPTRQILAKDMRVIVIDFNSPFHEWYGIVRQEKPGYEGEFDPSNFRGWFYECALLPPGDTHGAPLRLTFNQDQLRERPVA